ncbi:MAG: L-threonylcarbamoyladenylate synthase [Pelagibacteraceae bacterium]
MKNIYSNIFKVNNKNLSNAVKYLKKNELVGVPTETVYGLAGNAYSDISIKKIFNLKKRPKKNPLIIHYYSKKDLINDVEVNQKFLKLYKHFCPGPLTFILKKKPFSKISNIATSKLNTVAVRFPGNKTIRRVLRELKLPLAIPSANKSSGISPIKAKDVYEEFGMKIKFILDGGSSKIGIESTVLDLTKKLKILRPGFIGVSEIKKIIKSNIPLVKNQKIIRSPGLLKKHYSPGIPMKLNQTSAKPKCAFIIFGKKYKKNKNTFNLSRSANLDEAARNLYTILRSIKKKKYKKIHVVKIPNIGLGIAINDRLKHAAY